MAVDLAFKGVGQKPGIDIWRIEKMKVCSIPKQTYGSFYGGDAYILLSTKKDESTGKLTWDIHFWLGGECSTDEQGVAAYKTVELDDSMGGTPVQHREVQDHESSMFLSYFKKGIKYLEGGVASGFKHVEKEENIKRLMRVKGKKHVRVRQVPCEVASLNKGDCFILDCGSVIYQWNGPDANRMEKLKAAIAAKEIRDEARKGKAKVKVIDLQWEDDPDFFAALGSKGRIKEAKEVKDDVEHEKLVNREVRLWRISDESGSLKSTPISAAPLTQKHLSHDDAFILDTGAPSSGIFVWIGKGCTKKEKSFACINAEKFLTERQYPKWTKVTSVIDGGEVPLFKQFFKDWRDPEDQKGLGHIYHRHKIAKNMPEDKVDINLMHSRHAGLMPGLMPDEGQGKVQIWRIENNTCKPVSAQTHGYFFGGDSYVVQYEATNAAKDIIIYYWLGKSSSPDEKAYAAKKAKEIDDSMGGKPISVRVAQGKEPEHFLRIFKGKMIVFLAGKSAGFKTMKDFKGARLFHIRGTNETNTRAVQVEEKAANLNTNDVFVCETGSTSWVWVGKGADDWEKTMATNVAKAVSDKKPEIINEGSEPAAFWSALGGKADYETEKDTGSKPFYPARLFHLTNEPGYLTVNEIENFSQEDLDPDDVMLVDVNDCIFCWIGAGADEQERNEAERVATDYVKTDPSPRTEDDVSVVTVKQGKELPYFTCHFDGWVKDFWKESQDYENLKAELSK